MALRREEAWVTSALEDGSVTNAMVLAESIRRTKTTRTIAVITSRSVSKENRVALRKAFDAVFCVDDSFTPEGGSYKCKDVQAKVYVLSLRFFSKCVYLTPMSLVLENADKLFEYEGPFTALKNKEDATLNLSLFMFTPSEALWESLWESMNHHENGICDTFLTTWLLNQMGGIKTQSLLEETVANFSMPKKSLLTCGVKTHTPIIYFTGVPHEIQLSEKLADLAKMQTGIQEKMIMTIWLEIYNKIVSPSLTYPRNLSSQFSRKGFDDTFKNEPIAIIGMSCRYPGANTIEEFWNLLYQGEEGVREPPAFRWTKEHSLKVTQQERKTNAGFLSTKVDEFDARFFGVSPKEAAYMDPQARILHEVLWESLEDAGIDPLSLYGSHMGIFTGSWMNDYKDIVQGSTEKDFFRTYMGNSIGAAAARLSFLLGITGPSIATESGCSSAIVALDLAVKSLRNGETNLALAGGVNLLLHPFTSNIMDYVIAPDGRCKTFDSKADGFGRAEGCGMLVLKRLSDALRDRDNIWALVRGSAVSQEGLSRSLGTPTVHCEALAMQLALQDANVKPEEVSFVETHGTGTSVGDPMEVAAIAKAYHSRSRKFPLVIGSVKTNVGHTESCSGITGVMKAILAMQHELIPKHLNMETLNPEIFLDSIPAMIPLEPVAWPKVTGQPRIAGVSSFGITGTDGHVIIQEAPNYELPKFNLGLERSSHVLKISGKTSEALDDLLNEYENLFSERAGNRDHVGNKAFANAAYSANVGRAAFNHRAFIVTSDYADAVRALKEKQYLLGEVKDGENRQICFLFTGQGSQYPGMAKLLYDTSPIFRINFDACDRTLREMYDLSIRQVLWESYPSSKELSRTIYSQTSIFCVEYCLLKLWESWGIKPDYVLGHSLGEFCAAVAAGILDFEDALKLVAERSRLIDSLGRGSMLVIKASKPEIDKLLLSAKMDLDYAAVNNPEQTVVAGDTEKVQQFLTHLKGHSVKAIILEATHAFHSRHMDPMLEKYRKIAETIEYKQGNGHTQYVSGMEGRIIGDSSELMADYWVRHTREKVSFVDACAALRESGCKEFVEVGPQPVLSSFVMMNNEDMSLNCLPSLRRGTDDWKTILTSLGKLYLLGYNVDWKGYDEPYIRNKVSLPFHPQYKKSFWVECTSGNAAMIHPLVGYPMNNASALNIFQNDLTVKSVPYVKDHCIGERIVFPGAGYTEMCLSAGYCVANGLTEALESPRRPMRLENLRIEAPLELKEEKSCRLQVIVDLPESTANNKFQEPDQSNQQAGFRVKIYHQNYLNEEVGKWVLHASSTFLPVASTKEIMKKWNPRRIGDIISSNEPTTPSAFYKRVDEAGLRFGESFRMITRYWVEKQPDPKINVDEIVAEMVIPSDYNKYLLHPLIIDAVFQSGILTKHRHEDGKLKVPVRLGQLTMLSGIESDASNSKLYLHAWFENGIYSVFICTTDYTPIALVEDVEMLDTNVKTIESVLEQQSSRIPDAWEENWKVIPSPFTSAVEVSDVKPIFKDSVILDELRKLRNTPTEDVDLYMKTKRLLYLYILNALMELNWNPKQGEMIYVQSFCTELGIRSEFDKLVRFYFTVLQKESGVLLCESKCRSWWKVKNVPATHEQVRYEMNNLRLALQDTRVATIIAIHANLAKCLSKILTGRESALQLLFPTEEDKLQFSADNYYQSHPARRDVIASIGVVAKAIYEQTKAHNSQNSGRIYRVLEVGSGTGSLSVHLLEWLRESWGDHFEFYYTDISKSFFVTAEKRFHEFSRSIKFAIFDIEESPLSQGIPLNYFDMVAAQDVLHATRNLEETLVHLRQTLRPGGVLCFTETVVESTDITFAFGLLDGYWRFEDFHWRPHHCCVGGEVWQKVLNQCGFHAVNSYNTYVDEFACVTAVAAPQVKLETLKIQRTNTHEISDEWIVFSDLNNFRVTSQLASMLDASGCKVVMMINSDGNKTSPKELEVLNDNVTSRLIRTNKENSSAIESIFHGGDGRVKGIIYALGMDTNESNQEKVALPFLHIAKSILALQKPPQLYVLTQGVHAVTEDTITCHPSAGTLFGMVKCLKNENSDIFVRYIDLEQESPPSSMINQIVFELAMCRGSKEQQRVQVAYRGNVRYEPRLVKAAMFLESDALRLPPSTDRYHLKLPQSRVIQDLDFDILEEDEIGENKVEIKVKAYALNFKDILTILKPSAEFEQLNTVGLDFAGIVTKAGPAAKLNVGERVFGANFKEAQLPSHLVLDSNSMLRVPENMTYWEAATLPAVFSTAYYCLITIAKMKKDDTVLIHTGSGGVGLAAIQLAKHVGATIITTAGNERKRAYLRSLGIQHVFHSRNTSFEKNILRVTNGRGVDVVLNSITGPGIKEATLNSSAKNARFVEMSKLSIWTPEEVKALRPDVDYKIIDLTVLEREAWDELLYNLQEFLIRGDLKAIPFVKFDALHIRQAFQYFQKAKHIGKVVCAMPEVAKREGQFKVIAHQFNCESTYLITGGLGGIGFEVCKWMLGLGATDVVLTGRSPPKPDVAVQIKDLNENGANVMVRLGDIGNYSHCKAIIDEFGKAYKPLRGVMHCAGVLKDNLYPNQTWESFQATFTPKVTGTWNLHNLTVSLPLEHFVVFSSMTALVGTTGQPNHAAANCFEDAFIHYRHSLGLPGTTINWGQWAQVGVAKEINILGVLPVSVTRMLNGMELSLKTNKRQVCFSEFESFNNFGMMCPIVKSYLDERLWKQYNSASQSGNVFKADQFWKEMDEKETKSEKIDVMSAYLKVILRTALRLEPDEPLNDDANIQELGVDSLMMIELKNSIQSLLGSRLNVTVSLLKNCNTIRLISGAVVGKLLDDDSNEQDELVEPLPPAELLELLSKDCALDENIQPSSLKACKPSQIKTLLLTGATGNLAPYILSQLTRLKPSVEKVVCLMRDTGDSSSQLKQKMETVLKSMALDTDVDLDKLEFVSGDVAKERLGLSENMYNDLSESVDAVIHCATRTNHSEHYRVSENGKLRDSRSVNVGGLINVLKFAAAAKTKHVYYPSTFICGLFDENEEGTLPDDWPKTEAIQKIVENQLRAWLTSKCICELLLKQANMRGIPCKVFRFPWVAGDSETGRLNYLNNLYILRFLSFLKLNAMPSLIFPANFLPVDKCAEFSLSLFFNDEAPCEIFNIGHPKPHVEQEFVQVAKQEFGKELKVLEWPEFTKMLEDSETQIEGELKGLYRDQRLLVSTMANAVGFAKGYVASPNTFFINKKVTKHIPNYGQDIPSSMDILRKDLNFLKKIGFLNKFCMN